MRMCQHRTGATYPKTEHIGLGVIPRSAFARLDLWRDVQPGAHLCAQLLINLEPGELMQRFTHRASFQNQRRPPYAAYDDSAPPLIDSTSRGQNRPLRLNQALLRRKGIRCTFTIALGI